MAGTGLLPDGGCVGVMVGVVVVGVTVGVGGVGVMVGVGVGVTVGVGVGVGVIQSVHNFIVDGSPDRSTLRPVVLE